MMSQLLNKFKNKFDKLTISDPYFEVQDRFNLIESKDFPEIKRVEKEEITCNEMIIFFAITLM